MANEKLIDAAQQIAGFENAATNAIGSTVRICLAINGGALVALLAFLGSMAQAGQPLPRPSIVLAPFALGVVAAGLAGLTIAVSLNHMRNALYVEHRKQEVDRGHALAKLSNNWASAAFLFVCLSLAGATLGFVGAIFMFGSLPPAPDRTIKLESSSERAMEPVAINPPPRP